MQRIATIYFTLQSHGSTIEIVLRYERDHMAYPEDYWRIAVSLEQHGRNWEAENMVENCTCMYLVDNLKKGTQDVLKKIVA